jgi:inorganic pyrophosphatase
MRGRPNRSWRSRILQANSSLRIAGGVQSDFQGQLPSADGPSVALLVRTGLKTTFRIEAKCEIDAGLMTMIDSGDKDHKIIAVATADPECNSYHEASELPGHRLLMVRRFFQDYKQLECKVVEVDEILPATAAYPIINDALARYVMKHSRGR